MEVTTSWVKVTALAGNGATIQKHGLAKVRVAYSDIEPTDSDSVFVLRDYYPQEFFDTLTSQFVWARTVSGTVTLGVEEISYSGVFSAEAAEGHSGYELSGGFVERTTGQSGSNEVGSNFQYTTEQATAGIWKRFGFSSARQLDNDVQYWGETSLDFDQSKGLFGGLHMPSGVTDLFNFTDTSLEPAVTAGGLLYTEAAGSYDFSQCNVGDLVKVRFSFNIVPQIANSTVEVGMIFATRDAANNVTYTFPLTTQPIYFGTGSQGNAYLNRIEMSAYMASIEDVNARALPAIRCNNQILVQPLTTLITIVR